jgi:hypothetical protein
VPADGNFTTAIQKGDHKVRYAELCAGCQVHSVCV